MAKKNKKKVSKMKKKAFAPSFKMINKTAIDVPIICSRVISDGDVYDKEGSEAWGKIYDTTQAVGIFSSASNKYQRWQGGFWAEVLLMSKKGNWFLYSEGFEASKKDLYFKNPGINITPLSPEEAFEYLEKQGAGAKAFEKYFGDVLEEA